MPNSDRDIASGSAEALDQRRYVEAILRTMQQPLLVLDGTLTVETANDAFYRAFAVTADDTEGRKIYDLGNGQWDIPELRALLEEILPNDREVRDFRVAHEFEHLGHRTFTVNVDRIDRGGPNDRILLAMLDVTEWERVLRDLEGEREYVEKIVDASRDALLILEADLRVKTANETFYHHFGVQPSETEGRLVYDLGDGQWDIPKLRELLEGVLPENEAFDDFVVEHDFPGMGRRTMVLNARRVDHISLILLAIEDQTEAHRLQALRREIAAHQEFLLRLSDATRPLSDPEEIEGTACRLLAGFLDADRAYYVEVDERAGRARVMRDYVKPGASSIAGDHSVADFQWSVDILRRDDCHVVSDTLTSPLVPDADRAASAALEIIACAGAPVIKEGELVGAVCVTCSRPREWTESEIELLREVADRLWSTIERARVGASLRASEMRFRALVEATSDVTFRMSHDWAVAKELNGRGFMADTDVPDASWAERYIPPEDRPAVNEAIRKAVERKTPFEHEHRVHMVDGRIGWALSRAVPILDDDGNIVEWFGAATDMTERREREAILRQTRDELALATEASQAGWGTWDFARGVASWDKRAREIIGLGPDENSVEDWLERIHPWDREAFDAEMGAALAEEKPFDLEYRVVHRDGAVRVVHGTGVMRPARSGRPAHGTGLVSDVTELRRWQENQQMLVAELNHRVKNMLAVVISIANQTRRSSPDMESFSEAFGERLLSLSRAHAILTQSNWEGADLRELVEGAVSFFSPDDGERSEVRGPAVRLGPNAALSLSLALHELGTNAVKYGAWSAPGGSVGVRWRAGRDGSVALDWEEHGGPEVTPPRRQGFGTRLLTRGVARELGGEVSVDYARQRLRCRIEFRPWRGDGTAEPDASGG